MHYMQSSFALDTSAKDQVFAGSALVETSWGLSSSGFLVKAHVIC